MKTQCLALLAVIALAVGIGFNLLKAQPGAGVVLVFTGYGPVATNRVQVANFELRNTTSRAIWLCYSGGQSPLRAPLLERLVDVSPMTNNSQGTNVYSLSVGSFFMQGKQVLPGQKLLLEFPLEPGKPAVQVGISYYVGRFQDGNDFLGHLGTPILSEDASLKEKGAFYWDWSRRRLKVPKRHEVWCPQPVCFQTTR